MLERLRQGIAKAWPADVEAMAERAQGIADPAGCRGFLVQNDQNGQEIRNGAP